MELSRKEYVLSSIKLRKEQLEEGNLSLADRNRIEGEIASFEQELNVLIANEQAQEEQEAARKLVIQEATDRAAYILDNLVVEGMTMRELCAGESEYQLLRIAVQNEFIQQAEAASAEKQLLELQNREALRAAEDRELQLKRQNDELQSDYQELQKDFAALERSNIDNLQEINQVTLERDEALNKRDAAMAKVDGLELLVSEKQAQIDILRNEAALGAKAAAHVVDAEAQKQQMKSLAEQIKANRIKVYDVQPDDEINPRNYTAKRVDTDEIVTYNWAYKNNYIEIKDANEVSQFRAEYVAKNSVPDIPLATTVEIVAPVLPPFVTDEQFRGSVEGISEGETLPQDHTGGADVSPDSQNLAEPTLQEAFERIAALEAQVFGFVKGQEVA